MGTRGGRGAAGIITAALVAGALGGCTSGAPEVSATSATSSRAVPSRASTTPPTGSPSSGTTGNQQDLEAKIVAGAPPKDLTWRYPRPPASWKKLKTDRGTMQWQVAGRCVITLGQPAGLGTAATPDSRDVLEHTAEQNSTAFPGKPQPTYHGRRTRLVTNFVDGLQGTSQVTMQESLVHYGRSGRSRIVAYRSGDFALTAVSVCGTRQLFASASKSELDPFINKLQVRTTY